MFAGNAKTHFQVVGKDNHSGGYMMSPFGDARWDVDDKEKLKKIYKNPEGANMVYHNQEREYHAQRQMPQMNVSPTMPNYQAVREPAWGYCQQSEPYQNYTPNAQPYRNYVPVQAQTNQVYYQNQVNPACQYQQTKPQETWSAGNVQPVYNRVPVAKRNNGLNYEEVKQKPKTYCQPSYQNYQKEEAQNVQSIHSQSFCDQCCLQAPNKNSNQILEKNWKLSSHVPILIAGETGYKPLGPMEATPNPFFPAREKNCKGLQLGYSNHSK